MAGAIRLKATRESGSFSLSYRPSKGAPLPVHGVGLLGSLARKRRPQVGGEEVPKCPGG